MDILRNTQTNPSFINSDYFWLFSHSLHLNAFNTVAEQPMDKTRADSNAYEAQFKKIRMVNNGKLHLTKRLCFPTHGIKCKNLSEHEKILITKFCLKKD